MTAVPNCANTAGVATATGAIGAAGVARLTSAAPDCSSPGYQMLKPAALAVMPLAPETISAALRAVSQTRMSRTVPVVIGSPTQLLFPM